MGYRPMVNVNGREWCGNGLVFASEAEALASAKNLMSRWMLVTEVRVDEIDAPINYRWIGGDAYSGKLEAIEAAI